ncbi:DUF4334 domain-containing protein [Rhodococcus tukisamuensis]|uniref:GXWXG protein n=1 Tax=Rhodococcus tukisamuensis TaxID=168276 RepID=A0A1G6ZI07_9NOCA|nr:DUF4334 domain-containing protein [Rhodococcus tukisamuensis]SDE02268.1 GXWXG protein [Rhodococcus tukisamuensis]
MDVEQARNKFQELRAQSEGVSPTDLDAVWAALDVVAAADILGTWKGAVFQTGHQLCTILPASGWHGKTFHSVLDAKPLMCRDDEGNLYSNVKLGRGEASLWNIEFRGEVTATMVYDGKPIFDHFKRVDENTLMGIMNGKPEAVLDNGRHLYFLLERD